jgi:hypothetical protein
VITTIAGFEKHHSILLLGGFIPQECDEYSYFYVSRLSPFWLGWVPVGVQGPRGMA